MRQPDVSRVWSNFAIKSVDEPQRIIEGIASTPETDRVGDIVEPMGAEFSLPLPFLWQHDSERPIGHVRRAVPNARGINVTVQLASSSEPGTLKDRLDESWQSIKLGLVRGLSIGFKPIETSYIEATGGMHFLKYLLLEISAVTIAANASASISAIKRCDLALARPSQKGAPLSFLKSEDQSVQLPFLKTENRKGNARPWPFKQMTWEKTTPAQFAAKLSNHLLGTIGDVMVEGLTARDAQIKSLQEELAARSYKGAWQQMEYRTHNMVTFHGSIWICLRDTECQPGTSHDWQLAVKKGRDAR